MLPPFSLYCFFIGRMADEICFFNKDTLIVKAPKRSPLALRMVVLLFALACGVYICLICLRQTRFNDKIRFLNVRVIEEQPCSASGMKNLEIPNVHFPKPKTFSSCGFDGFLKRKVDATRGWCCVALCCTPLSRSDCSDLISAINGSRSSIAEMRFEPSDPRSDGSEVHSSNPKEECGCNPVRFFAILSMQRSGSGWFETLLNSHMNVSSNGEILGAKERRSNVSTIIDMLDKVYNLDFFTSASKNECSAAVGFKWMLNQGVMQHHKEIVQYFNKRGVSAIFLFRRNQLRRMISLLANSYDSQAKILNGTHKSHVHSSREAQILANYKPKVNATLLIHNLKEAEKTIAKALEYFKCTRKIVLYYEDIVSNRTKLVDVQEFLRLPYRELTSSQVKIHSGPLSKQIENWGDIQKAITGTPYESFLNQDYQL
ncbi:hypothetical protein RHMOL_Rhmol07G0295000 [Rhododendron molle]|uniref:Uncharacterized protein n=1 Tax=Rhododendron molle TaxID=49168 RepID=A0ACC0N835_RHOML|nr:hypothetical protein RHMOL_Rhmol07G0295000 [Rhododendron molle]